MQAITRCCSLPSLPAFSLANCLLSALLLGSLEEPVSRAANKLHQVGLLPAAYGEGCCSPPVPHPVVPTAPSQRCIQLLHQAGVEDGDTDAFCAEGKARQPCFGLIQSQHMRTGPNPSPFLSSCLLARGMQWGPLSPRWIPGCCGVLACSPRAGAVCAHRGSGPFPVQGRGETACVNSTSQDIKCTAVG